LTKLSANTHSAARAEVLYGAGRRDRGGWRDVMGGAVLAVLLAAGAGVPAEN